MSEPAAAWSGAAARQRAAIARSERSAVSEPAAARPGAAARQRAAVAQSEPRLAASSSGTGAAVEPRRDAPTCGTTTRRMRAHTSALRAEHSEREQSDRPGRW